MTSRFVAATPRRRSVMLAALLCLGAPLARAEPVFMPPAAPAPPLGGARVTGQVTGVIGATLQLKLRDGQTVLVDLREARARHLSGALYDGEFVQVQGRRTGQGTIAAVAITRAKSAAARWTPDIR